MENLTDTLSGLVAEHGFQAVQEALDSLSTATTNDATGDPNQPPHGPGGNPPPPPPKS